MILRKILITAFVLVLVSNLFVEAQTKRIYKGQYHRGKSSPNISLKGISKNELITLYGTTGYATYYGDLCDGVDCFKFRPQLGVSVLMRTSYLGKRLNLRADIRYFRLYSDDVYKYRNLDFRSSNFEFLALGQFELFPYEKLMRRRPKINPYIYAGVGFMTYNPYGKTADGSWTQLRPLQTEHTTYGSIAMVYTGGIGLKFKYNYKWSFVAEGGYRYTFTDHIDDVSIADYPTAGSFNNTLSGQMSNKSTNFPYPATPQDYRGNPKNNDGYFIFSAGVAYTFTKKQNAKFKHNQQLLRK
jgi:hypothetical protein